MVADDLTRATFLIDAPEAAQSKQSVEAVFGKQNWLQYIGISEESDSPVGGARVVTAYYHMVPDYLIKRGVRMARRKFCLDTGCVHEKLIDFVSFDLNKLPALPPSTRPIATSENHCIIGYKVDPTVERYADAYFYADPAECEAFFGLPRVRGTVQTSYGITYDVFTKAIVRVKAFTCDNADIAPNWEGLREFAQLQ